MSGKSVEAHSRVMLMHECTVREFSTLLMQKIIDLIGNAREKWGHPAAEKKAEELRKIIERSETEEEILAAIAAMETKETKDDTRE